MKLATFLILFLFNTAFCQTKDTIYARVPHEVDSLYEKIVGMKWVDWKDGSKPGFYYIVEVDYGEPPPNHFELLEAWLKGRNICRGWSISFERKAHISGWTEGVSSYIISSTNEKATFYYKKYTDTLFASYGKTLLIEIK